MAALLSDSSVMRNNPSLDPLNPYGIWSPEPTQQSGSGPWHDPDWVPGTGDDTEDPDSKHGRTHLLQNSEAGSSCSAEWGGHDPDVG